MGAMGGEAEGAFNGMSNNMARSAMNWRSSPFSLGIDATFRIPSTAFLALLLACCSCCWFSALFSPFVAAFSFASSSAISPARTPCFWVFCESAVSQLCILTIAASGWAVGVPLGVIWPAIWKQLVSSKIKTHKGKCHLQIQTQTVLRFRPFKNWWVWSRTNSVSGTNFRVIGHKRDNHVFTHGIARRHRTVDGLKVLDSGMDFQYKSSIDNQDFNNLITK